jgi:hypothetical protein
MTALSFQIMPTLVRNCKEQIFVGSPVCFDCWRAFFKKICFFEKYIYIEIKFIETPKNMVLL